MQDPPQQSLHVEQSPYVGAQHSPPWHAPAQQVPPQPSGPHCFPAHEAHLDRMAIFEEEVARHALDMVGTIPGEPPPLDQARGPG